MRWREAPLARVCRPASRHPVPTSASEDEVPSSPEAGQPSLGRLTDVRSRSRRAQPLVAGPGLGHASQALVDGRPVRSAPRRVPDRSRARASAPPAPARAGRCGRSSRPSPTSAGHVVGAGREHAPVLRLGVGGQSGIGQQIGQRDAQREVGGIGGHGVAKGLRAPRPCGRSRTAGRPAGRWRRRAAGRARARRPPRRARARDRPGAARPARPVMGVGAAAAPAARYASNAVDRLAVLPRRQRGAARAAAARSALPASSASDLAGDRRGRLGRPARQGAVALEQPLEERAPSAWDRAAAPAAWCRRGVTALT